MSSSAIWTTSTEPPPSPSRAPPPALDADPRGPRPACSRRGGGSGRSPRRSSLRRPSVGPRDRARARERAVARLGPSGGPRRTCTGEPGARLPRLRPAPGCTPWRPSTDHAAGWDRAVAALLAGAPSRSCAPTRPCSTSRSASLDRSVRPLQRLVDGPAPVPGPSGAAAHPAGSRGVGVAAEPARRTSPSASTGAASSRLGAARTARATTASAVSAPTRPSSSAVDPRRPYRALDAAWEWDRSGRRLSGPSP